LQTQQPGFSSVFPSFYANSLWTNNIATQRGFIAPQPMPASPSAQFQSAYQAYMASYCNYMYQMMAAVGNNPNAVQFSPQFLLNNQQMLSANLPLQPQQANRPQQAFAAEPNLAAPAAAPAAGGIVQEAVAGDVDGQQRDFLDVVYKV
uniref:VHS domain-containing protein n=1 Tax=Gongylonema pulchrum TaxID=637853 RepID=A0A183EUJ1_9BILA